MQEKYNIGKTNLNKENYTKVIDNSFTQLVPPPSEPVVEPTVDNFFQLYNDLFYDIPKEGEINSHQYLIEQSSEYIGNPALSEEFLALVEEVNTLRTQLLEANQQILELESQNISGSTAGIDQLDLTNIGNEAV